MTGWKACPTQPNRPVKVLGHVALSNMYKLQGLCSNKMAREVNKNASATNPSERGVMNQRGFFFNCVGSVR